MFEFIRANQMDIMLALCAACLTMAFMLLITRFLPMRRKWVLINMELTATGLLFFDRLAYIYAGDVSTTGYVMVRLSNFFVFFLTSWIVFAFDLSIIDLLNEEDKMNIVPLRLKVVAAMGLVGSAMAVLSQFTNLYYYFDENNQYHRGQGFLISYIIPILGPIISYTVVFQYRKKLSKLMNIAIFMYVFVPIIMGIIQIYAYGISIVNMAMVFVSMSLYVFTYVDVNDEVEKLHSMEMENLQNEQKSMKRLFDETVTSFVTAAEKKDRYAQGHAVKVAQTAKRIAQIAGKSEERCDEVYYAALLHDVGMIGLPDRLIGREEDLSDEEYELIKQKPVLGGEILSSISEFPYLSLGARYSHERYDGGGYPDGLKGENIPDTARIIAIADAYVSMESKKSYRDPLPAPMIREAFVMQAGAQFDPEYSDIMVKLIDSGTMIGAGGDYDKMETEIRSVGYRENISKGVEITDHVVKLFFTYTPLQNDESGFSDPSLIMFDAFDERVHENAKSIEAYQYTEYGEVWFDGHCISTNVREMISHVIEDKDVQESSGTEASQTSAEYAVTASKFEDHVKLVLEGPEQIVEVIAALPDKTKSVFLALTGENCYLSGIRVEKTGEIVHAEDIRRIADEIDYTNRMVSDLPNIQIDRSLSAATEGLRLKDHLRLRFHFMSLPSASLVWHCPYLLLYSSKDGKIDGEDYIKYELLKLNGESDGSDERAQNSFSVEKKSSFKGWDNWKEECKRGIDCEILIKRRGNRIITNTENLGIAIEDITTIKDASSEVYVAITGDQIALTDIRIK